MRTYVNHGLAAIALFVIGGCSNSQPARDPANANSQQETMTNPAPQPGGTGFAMDNTSGTAMNAPSAQQSALPSSTSAGAMNDSTAQKPFGAGTTAPSDPAQAQAKTAKPLTSDGEVLAFAVAVNDGEVQMAEIAKKNADSTDVKQFAAMMQTHHTQALNKLRTLQGKTKVQPAESDLSQKVKSDATENMAMLRDKKGKEFDRVYIDSQVRMHKDALDAIDNQVLQGAQNGEVKTQLNEMRRQVAAHLAKATDIQKKVEPQTGASNDDVKGTTGNKSVSAKGNTDLDDKAAHKAHDAKQDLKKGANDAKEDMKH